MPHRGSWSRFFRALDAALPGQGCRRATKIHPVGVRGIPKPASSVVPKRPLQPLPTDAGLLPKFGAAIVFSSPGIVKLVKRCAIMTSTLLPRFARDAVILLDQDSSPLFLPAVYSASNQKHTSGMGTHDTCIEMRSGLSRKNNYE